MLIYAVFFQLTGRKVLSEEDVIERILHSSPRNFCDLNERSMSKMGSMGHSNQQVNIKVTLNDSVSVILLI